MGDAEESREVSRARAEWPKVEPPTAQDLPIGSTLRFAVGDPNDMRSTTWNVVGGKKDRDIYIGARQAMNHHKLSLHRSGKWRLAEVMERGDGEDRVLVRYEPPPEVFPGWRFAAQILIPTSSLRSPYPEKATSDKRAISWWVAPRAGWTLSFNIFLGERLRDDSFTVNCIGQVGRMELSGECVVWVLADEIDSKDSEIRIQDLRLAALRNSKQQKLMLSPTAAAWAIENETGRAIIYDLGDLNNASVATTPKE
jgi:hypothetical protein